MFIVCCLTVKAKTSPLAIMHLTFNNNNNNNNQGWI